MRESFGGAFMIKLILVFIVLYISFMAVAVNYAKAFRIKNNVINVLEQNQFHLTDSFENIDKYLTEAAYINKDNNSIKSNCNNVAFGTVDTSKKTILTTNGVCIQQKLPNDDSSATSFYYKVTSYIAIEFPLFKISMVIPISGETKTIEKIS